MATNLKPYLPVVEIDLGVDTETGLSKRKNVKRLLIIGEERKMQVDYEVVLVTPEGFVADILFQGKKTVEGQEYDTFEAHPVGQGVQALLLNGLVNYPNE